MTDRYFIKGPRDGDAEDEVTKSTFVAFERANGFHNTMGKPDEPGTASFHGRYGSGRIRYGER